MSFNFVIPQFNINGAGTPPFQFYRRGFILNGTGGSQPSWKDIILKGVTALTLVNAKANGLNYLKLFGDTEQLAETYIDSVTLGGKCGQSGTPTPTVPVDIVCNNGAIKYSANMCNVNAQTALVGYYITTGGVVTADTYNWIYQDFIPVKPNTTYTLTMSSAVYYVSISEYSTADDSGFVIRKTGSTGSNTTLTITTEATTNYVRFGTNLNRTAVTLDKVLAINWMLNVGNSMAYQPYVEGGIYTDGTVETVTDNVGNVATAERLLSVGNYKDTQEVLNGSVTRNVGIKVFNGTEDWTTFSPNTNTYNIDIPDAKGQSDWSTRGAWCSHFSFWISDTTPTTSAVPPNTMWFNPSKGLRAKVSTDIATTLAQLKQWLADQYNAGTPVIMVYPTSSATTESVTPQFLSKEPVTVTGSLTGLVANVVSSSHTTPTPTQPLPINCNNGVVKYGQYGKNLFDKNTALLGDISTNGDYVYRTYRVVSDYIPVRFGQTFVGSGTLLDTNGVDYEANVIKAFYKADKSYINGSRGSVTGNKFTINDETCAYIRIVFYNQSLIAGKTVIVENSVLQLEEGETATPYEPYHFGIHTDGTVETVEVTGKNLFNPNSPLLKTQAPNISGTPEYPNTTPTQYPNAITYFMTVQPNTAYTYSCSTKGDRFGVWGINSIINPDDYTTSNRLRFDSVIIAGHSSNVQTVYNFTTGANTKMIAVYCALSTRPTDIQIEQGSTATTYENYFNGGSATAEMLLKVGTYQDIQSVLDGEVKRKVGIKVLDGTEDWAYTNSRFRLEISDYLIGSSIMATIISHYKLPEIGTASIANGEARFGKLSNISAVSSNNILAIHDDNYTDLNSYKSWLADQYNAGSPVVILYPLATPTTETVTGQPMNIQAGNNTVSIVQASMDNLELEVSYKAGVEVTVTEIENAQLDNSVEVTVNG